MLEVGRECGHYIISFRNARSGHKSCAFCKNSKIKISSKSLFTVLFLSGEKGDYFIQFIPGKYSAIGRHISSSIYNPDLQSFSR